MVHMSFAVGELIADNDIGDLFSLAEWHVGVKAGMFSKYDGDGCWVQDNRFMTNNTFDDVFAEPPFGATHVMWYNK